MDGAGYVAAEAVTVLAGFLGGNQLAVLVRSAFVEALGRRPDTGCHRRRHNEPRSRSYRRAGFFLVVCEENQKKIMRSAIHLMDFFLMKNEHENKKNL